MCRGAVRLFAEFYQADVIIASPLGLATALSAAAAEGAGGADFLSSIEIAVVDRADVMLMQNWAHVTTGAGPNYLAGQQGPSVQCQGQSLMHAQIQQKRLCAVPMATLYLLLHLFCVPHLL